MKYDLRKEARLFMIFDILGDTERSGPLLWKIDRKRLEDVKNHTFDLLLIARILKRYLPDNLNFDKINDYILCHDLPEAITGDITKFEGVSNEKIKRVTDIAINWLCSQFDDILDFSTIFKSYENKIDLESKVVHMIDKIHSSTTFIKYQSEKNVDMNHPDIIPDLRNHPFVVQKIAQGKDLADIFFEYHLKAVCFTEEEMQKYHLTESQASEIINIITTFATEIYLQKFHGPWSMVKEDFPVDAMLYNRNVSKA
mgnify:CR=1 FL=1